jgi:glycine cleavage system aminomethyltransferase T
LSVLAPDDFAFQLFNDDWDHFEPHFFNALKLFPELGEVGVEMLNGPESFTPDGRYILGEAPELDNCFVAAGMNSSGIASAGGAGKALAEWMEHGEPLSDLWPLDIRRFGKHDSAPNFLKDRVSETLGLHYTMPYPRKELSSARNVRQSPLYEKLDACGAVWGSKFGWERPLYFRPEGSLEGSAGGDDDTGNAPFQGPNDWLTFGRPKWLPLVKNETRACREACVLFDVTSFGKISVQGADASLLMDRVCANDVDGGMDKLVYTGMLNERGGYEADITVSRKGSDAFMLTTATSNVNRDMAWLRAKLKELRRQRQSDDGPMEVTLADVTGQFCVLSLMGPTSRQVLQELTARPQALEAEDFPSGTTKDVDIGNVVVTANRVSYVGELGYELLVPQEYARNVYDSLRSVRIGGEVAVTNAGYYAIESMRIEKGFRAWGHELDPDVTPKSAGLNFTVSAKKRGFIGRDAAVAAGSGSNQRVASFVFEDDSVMPWGGEPIVMNGEEYVGQLTSATYGCEVERGVGLGVITHEDVWRKGFLKGQAWTAHVGSRVARVRASFKPPVRKRGVD